MSEAKKRVPKRRFKAFLNSGDWEQRKLGDIVDFLDGQRKPLKESDRIKGKYPYYGASGIIDYINDYLFDENLVLLSEDGANIIDRNYPVCFIATGKYWVNNHAHVLKVKTGVIDKFICESLERLDYTKFNTGTAQPKLNQDICQKIVITIPNEDEQKCISEFLDRINNIITLHQSKLDKLQATKKALLQEMFPEEGQDRPKRRFKGFSDAWEQHKLGDLYKRVNERNDGTLGRDKWISVAKMYFQDPDKVQSNNLDTRTYVMKKGDIAFEGHPNNEFRFGRFVLNDIGTGIISELFPIYRPITEYDLDFWKYAIQLERVMAPIFAKSITSSGNSSNKLDHNHFLNQELLVPNIEEQKKIGTLLSILSKNITLHQRKLDKLKNLKQAYLNEMFV